jgi:CheY-like chemotaxis protein/anti-sigma regulatory factor (Ser/Thr protein kinase)
LTATIDPLVPAAIAGDAGRLRQVLINLLSNAVKFTDAGEVTLAVAASQTTPDGRERISFVVRDTGPGIAPDHQQRIFESFSQVDASISRKYGGTGLGLAISKSLAEQMGGAMWVESEPGRGAAFHFNIVAETADLAPAPAPQPPVAGAANLPPLRVMVADDNAVNRKVALSSLKRLGYQADAAVNGVELLERLRHAVYDIVFMDVQMPEMDGLEATRRIRRELPPARQPRIVAMTAAAFPEDRARCLNAGMDDYVAKPVGMEELGAVLRRARPLTGA